MMAVPVDADACISESFVAAIERDVVTDLPFVFFGELLCACQSRFFVGSKNKNQIALCFDLGMIKRPYGREQCLDIARVVANSRRIDSAIADGSFDLETGLKNSVQMGVKNYDRPAAGSFPHCDYVAG